MIKDKSKQVIKDKKTAFVIYVVLFVVFWNIAEHLWKTAVATGSGISGFDIITPLIVAIVTGYLFFIAKSVNINDELKEARKTDGAVIIDVRSSDEYAQGHIPGAINIPVDDIERVSSIIADKNAPLFTYCLRGSRSIRAAKTLKAMGYSKVISMGGINKYKGEQKR